MDTLAHMRPATRPTTQAAEGLPRWHWTTDDLVRISATGVFDDMDRFELIGGEIVPMPADGERHANLADQVEEAWINRDPVRLRVAGERQLNLAPDTHTKPDILVWPKSIKIADLRGPEALLVVEVSDTSLAKDQGFKRRLYASFGVREYWVIDVTTRSTRVHKNLRDGDYQDVTDAPPSAMLTPTLAPVLALRLADLVE